MHRAIILLLLLAAIHTVSAQEIVNYNISVWLGEDSAYEEISMAIFNQMYFPLKTFSYVLRGDVRDVRIYDSEGGLEVNTTRESRGSVIQSRFRESLQPNGSVVITLRFNVTHAVSKTSEGYVFSPVFSLPTDTGEFTLRVELPEGMGLPRPISGGAGFTDVVPLPDSVYSDGKAIIFEWRRHGAAGDFAVYVRYIRLNTKEKDLYLIALLLVTAAGGYYLYKRRRKRPRKPMGGDEERVLHIIEGTPGIVQKEIADITGFSKAKVSMIVSSLEKEGLVRKEKFGLKNRLYLTEKRGKP